MNQKRWIDGGIFLLLFIALHLTVGPQPLWKAVVVGMIVGAMRESYHWSKS